MAENQRRVDNLFRELKGSTVEQTASVGQQDFILNREQELSSSEAELYFRDGDSQRGDSFAKGGFSMVETELSYRCSFILTSRNGI